MSKIITYQNIIKQIREKFKVNGIKFWEKYLPNIRHVGNYLMTLCPFHDDQNPSFVVHKDNLWFFRCYGCDEKGDAITFLRKFKNISFEDALKELAKFCNLEIQLITSEILLRKKKIDILEEKNAQILEEESKLITEIEEIKLYSFYDFKARLLYSKLKIKDKVGKKEYKIFRSNGEPGLSDNQGFKQEQVLYGLKFFSDEKSGLIIVEGEKDAETLLNIPKIREEYNILGYSSFENDFKNTLKLQGGAKFLKWLHSKCKCIVICEDNDETGFKNTVKILKTLQDFNIFTIVKVLTFHNLPEKSDISDYFKLQRKKSSYEIDLAALFQELLEKAPIIYFSPYFSSYDNSIDTIKSEEQHFDRIFVLDDGDLISKVLQKNNLVLFEDSFLKLSEEELSLLFKGAIIYMSRSLYKSIKKFRLAVLKFESEKFFLINNAEIEEDWDRSKNMLSLTFTDLHQNIQTFISEQNSLTSANENENKQQKQSLIFPSPRFIDERINLPEGTLTVLAGLGSAGKTTFSLLYSLILLYENKVEKIAFLSFEETIEIISYRLYSIFYPLSSYIKPDIKKNLLLFCPTKSQLFYILDFLARNHYKLIFIDNLTYLLNKTDENQSIAVSQLLSKLAEFTNLTKTTIVLLHHLRKSSINEFSIYRNVDQLLFALQSDVRGSSVIVNIPRVVYIIFRYRGEINEKSEPYTFIATIKTNFPPINSTLPCFHIAHFSYLSRFLRNKMNDKISIDPSSIFQPGIDLLNKLLNGRSNRRSISNW